MSTRRRTRRLVAPGLALAVVAMAVLTVGIGGLGAALTPGQEHARTESVLLVGDSLLHQAARGITSALPGSSVVDASVPGSGLLDGAVDWYARARDLLDRYHPDVVVVSFVGNYERTGGTLVVDSPDFYAAWSAAAQRLTDLVRASGARVDWVAQPPLHSPNFYGVGPERTEQLYVTYATLAREHGVDLLDADDAVAAADGTFSEQGDVCGATVTLRIADGVHFTAVGGDWWGVHLARVVAQVDNVQSRDVCRVIGELDPAV